jgi:hypothetical protein
MRPEPCQRIFRGVIWRWLLKIGGNGEEAEKCNLVLELPDYESCILFRHVETVEIESNTLEESRMLKNV